MMPDSPETKTPSQVSPPISANASSLSLLPRPLSSNSSSIGVDGSHGCQSPLSTLNGRSPSPQSFTNSSANQQLPPACGARQLSKLKRFLTTLQQFGSDISPVIGERVRTLVLALVNNHISIEDFHSKLQETTNFPLRPFVIPFLKANLPLLQRELHHCARMAKQSPQNYLQYNDHILLNISTSSSNDSHHFGSLDINENGKRKSPDRSKENGIDSHLLSPRPNKRLNNFSPPKMTNGLTPPNLLTSNCVSTSRLDDLVLSRDHRLERERERYDQERFYPHSHNLSRDSNEVLDRIDDDWKHVESLLQCIVGMVEKVKRTLSVLQEKSLRDREELSSWNRHNSEGLDSDLKKRHDEIIAINNRQTEERVLEVKRRAEEAVNEVKRQALSELQKAVSASEVKANELVMAEREKMEKLVSDAKRAAQEEFTTILNQQSDSRMNCWNCGRKANETCSGCNAARYCGSFCQHKDWESHHLICGKTSAKSNPSLSSSDDADVATQRSPQETKDTLTATATSQ